MGLQARLDSLRQEIETLRQRLDVVKDEGPGLAKSEETIRISYKLDQLIAEFLRVKERVSGCD